MEFLKWINMRDELSSEIKNIAQASFLASIPIYLESITNHDICIHSDPNKLHITWRDTSKPRHYKELQKMGDNLMVVDKECNSTTRVTFDYPYITDHHPERLVATEWNMFVVMEYTKVPASTSKRPDFRRVEELIYEALEILKVT